MAEDLQCQAEGSERLPGGVRRRHGGQDVEHHMARRLLRGYHKGVAIGVVLYHRAARPRMGSGPRVLIWHPHAAHLLEREGHVLG